MVKKAGTAQHPSKREKRRPLDEDYTVINLSMLTRFHIFLDEVRSAEGPVSFRFFMKNRGSHRTMALTVDTIEELSQQLLLRREILDGDGRATGRYLTDYKGLEHVPTRRTHGVSPRDITAHGEVWGELGILIGELFDLAIDGDADPRGVLHDLHEIRRIIARHRLPEK